jgi:hypothetical protein
MTLHKRTFKQFAVTMTVIILMLLGVSTVFATTGESMMASDAPIYSEQDPTSWFSYMQTESGNASFVPFEIELNLNKVGSVIPSEGVATVSGSVICSQPSNVSVYGELERRIGRVKVRGYFYSYFRCDGKANWSATVTSQTGPFVGGKAKISASAYAYSDYGFDYDQANRTIILKGSPPSRPYYSSLLESPKASTTVLTFGILGLGLVAGMVLVIGSPKKLKRFWER